MININLLKYFDKSFSEIHQFENEETVPKKNTVFFTKKRFYLPLLSILIVVFTFSAYNLWTTISGLNNNIQINDKAASVQKSARKKRKTQKKQVVAVTIDNVSDNNKNYQRPEINDEDTIDKKISKNKHNTPVENNTPAPLPTDEIKTPNNKNVKKAQQNKKSYVIIIKRISEEDIEELSKLSEIYEVRMSKTLELQKSRELWHVFSPVKSSGIKIGDNYVKILATFTNKDKATNFAKKQQGKIFVKKENFSYKEYNVKIEGFKSIDKAKEFAGKLQKRFL